MSTQPRYATARTPALKSDGAAIAAVAKALGTPLMESQRLIVDVATEHHPTRPGAWRYPIVVVTIPRQSGKTTTMRAVMTQRALTEDHLQAFYTAQTGKDARARWRELVAALENGPLETITEVRRSQGTEAATLKPTGSFIAPFAPTPKSLHGYTPDLVVIDEAFSFDAAQGSDLMGAIVPAQQTLPGRQLWIVSTAGDSRSAFLREWVERGRAATGDPDSSIAYFEWSCPDDVDPFDPQRWADWHPALGHTIDAQAIADAANSLPRGEFIRAYANRWTVATETVISIEDLAACAREQTPADPSVTVLGWDVAPDRSAAAIWAAWKDADGTVCLRPYMARPGTSWLIPALTQAKVAGFDLWADDAGAARALTDAATRSDIPVTTLAARDMAAATGNIIQAITEHTISLPGDGCLDDAAAGAITRTMSGVPVWDRTGSTGPIHHLTAATIAMWAAEHQRRFWTLP